MKILVLPSMHHKNEIGLKNMLNFLNTKYNIDYKFGTKEEINDYDIELLKQLSQGLSQEDISHNFKTNAISPNSLSTIEKRLNKLRIQFKANNAIHLVAIVKDLGLI